MKFRDNRSIPDQIKSGARIACSFVASLAAVAIFVAGYRNLIGSSMHRNIGHGLFLLAGVGIFLAVTVRHWRLWFPGIPGFLGLRLIGGFYFGWFAADYSGVWNILFPVLMFFMAALSIRFSRKHFRMRVLDQAVLFAVLIFLLLAISNLVLSGVTRPTIVFSAIADGILLLSWLYSRWFGIPRRTRISPVARANENFLR